MDSQLNQKFSNEGNTSEGSENKDKILSDIKEEYTKLKELVDKVSKDFDKSDILQKIDKLSASTSVVNKNIGILYKKLEKVSNKAEKNNEHETRLIMSTINDMFTELNRNDKITLEYIKKQTRTNYIIATFTITILIFLFLLIIYPMFVK